MPTFRKPANGWCSSTPLGNSRTKQTTGAGNWNAHPNSPSTSQSGFLIPFSCALWAAFNFSRPRGNIFNKPEPVCRAFPLMHCGAVQLFARSVSISVRYERKMEDFFMRFLLSARWLLLAMVGWDACWK
jgi:hypothetical protein